jgi:hypothetical protein
MKKFATLAGGAQWCDGEDVEQKHCSRFSKWFLIDGDDLSIVLGLCEEHYQMYGSSLEE